MWLPSTDPSFEFAYRRNPLIATTAERVGIDARYWDALGKRVVKGSCGSFEGCGDVFIGDVAAFVMVIVES